MKYIIEATNRELLAALDSGRYFSKEEAEQEILKRFRWYTAHGDLSENDRRKDITGGWMEDYDGDIPL